MDANHVLNLFIASVVIQGNPRCCCSPIVFSQACLWISSMTERCRHYLPFLPKLVPRFVFFSQSRLLCPQARLVLTIHLSHLSSSDFNLNKLKFYVSVRLIVFCCSWSRWMTCSKRQIVNDSEWQCNSFCIVGFCQIVFVLHGRHKRILLLFRNGSRKRNQVFCLRGVLIDSDILKQWASVADLVSFSVVYVPLLRFGICC